MANLYGTANPALSTENRAAELEISIYVMTAVSLVFLVARIACKVRYGKKITLDDHILAFSWALLAVYAGTAIATTKHGVGRHLKSLSHDQIVRAHYFMTIADAFNIVSISVSKTSFAVTILRLSSEVWHKILIWTIMVTINLFAALSCVFIFTSCSPTKKVWDPDVPGSCWNARMLIDYYIVIAAWSAATDFILAIFPWVLIWGLNMRKVEKFGICVAMSLGVLSGITAAMKTSYIATAAKWTDWTYTSVELLTWAGAETAVVIIAASIPFLRLALKGVTNKVSHGRRSRGYHLDYISGGGQSGHHVIVKARGRRPDDGSDRSILGETSFAPNTITKTQAVAVSYYSRMGI